MKLDAKSIIEAVGETLAEERNQRLALEARVRELERALAELRGAKPLRAVPPTPALIA